MVSNKRKVFIALLVLGIVLVVAVGYFTLRNFFGGLADAYNQIGLHHSSIHCSPTQEGTEGIAKGPF